MLPDDEARRADAEVAALLRGELDEVASRLRGHPRTAPTGRTVHDVLVQGRRRRLRRRVGTTAGTLVAGAAVIAITATAGGPLLADHHPAPGGGTASARPDTTRRTAEVVTWAKSLAAESFPVAGTQQAAAAGHVVWQGRSYALPSAPSGLGRRVVALTATASGRLLVFWASAQAPGGSEVLGQGQIGWLVPGTTATWHAVERERLYLSVATGDDAYSYSFVDLAAKGSPAYAVSRSMAGDAVLGTIKASAFDTVIGRVAGGAVVADSGGRASLWRDGSKGLTALPGVAGGDVRALSADVGLVPTARDKECASPLTTLAALRWTAVGTNTGTDTLWRGCTASGKASSATTGPLAPDGAYVIGADNWFAPVSLTTGNLVANGSPTTTGWAIQPSLAWETGAGKAIAVQVTFQVPASGGRATEYVVRCRVDRPVCTRRD